MDYPPDPKYIPDCKIDETKLEITINPQTEIATIRIVSNLNIQYLNSALAAIMEGLNTPSHIEPARVTHTALLSPKKKYDVFVSHASEDKTDFVDNFVEIMRARGINVWYDTNTMNWGDSIISQIEYGLNHARFIIPILSPHFIQKHWTRAEIDSAFHLEEAHSCTLLPIFHKVSKADVLNFSPLLASKKALTTATMTTEEIVDSVVHMLYAA
jgi:hypothetical protein